MQNRETIRVALAVGDIYGSEKIPPLFEDFSGIFEYTDKMNISTNLTVPDFNVEIVGFALLRYDEQVQCLVNNSAWNYRSTNMADRLRMACKLVGSGEVPGFGSDILELNHHLVVIGQTPLLEAAARAMARTKLMRQLPLPILIRFSTFYGKESRHTGLTAADVGYNLDMPKSLFGLEALLRFEPLLNWLANPHEEMAEIIRTLNQMPEFQEKPVLLV